ncbi:rhodanese-like domain-containing protein [Ilyobacter polytropus]|uniref:Rhodanese domain protein n=1 Tax=Ilyobacter polytropus (strain ATCC 51220 / DSM 2926 / LMG 16218 / CuHBu1) TaxID=572544 RepID=E3HD53_ILYPC|nr:rhodanese-like domain-containing protein [Ilyobacter polytropus]ADO84529.1 Rhodanese domain protein [Ilyobacter polytropus DSM 2926]
MVLNFFKRKSDGFKIVSVEEAKNLIEMKKDMILIDVRTEKENKFEGNIDGAILIDFLKLNHFKKELEKLDKELPYLVFCAIGGRSKAAAALMTKMGFNEVYDMAGGIKAWQKENNKNI